MFFTSPTKANLIEECPRCYWHDIRKVAPRPRGIMSSLPAGIDSLLKERYDAIRETGVMPSEFKEIDGILCPDMALIKKLRHWKSAPSVVMNDLGIALRGGLDDEIIHKDGSVSPLDYKSKSSEPEEGYSEKYYQKQMEDYSLMLERTGVRVSGFAYLAFFCLDDRVETHSEKSLSLGFKIVIQKIVADPVKAIERLKVASAILMSETEPEASKECDYCTFAELRR